ncbi:MAG: glutamate--tRNA ligase [Candidatus Omnitrophica bacterium]|nr:glutamate--tRNA ligase [Candidatus Omnitrophota bacterium]
MEPIVEDKGNTPVKIRVRFAPSPTGFLHIGGARTALFNWMYARAQGGIFILRIEDTDAERSKVEYLDEILRSMKWLGLNWDEFYKQSERFDIYRKYAGQLLAEGKAYKDGEAVILKMLPDQVKIFDLIRGEIQFDTETIKDQVLMKSDGTPTYSFACVVDDALMEVSHVIRGEDHISNTPKQIMIYQALGFKIPKFAHLPLIMDEEGGRMSKRAGAVAVSDYQVQGFLPEGIVNYLMLLGWSPGNNQEKVNLDAAVKKFSIKKVNKAGAAFSMDKLKWLNTQYIKEMPVGQLTDLLLPFLKEKGYGDNTDRKWLEEVVKLYQPRMSTLLDFMDWADYLFEANIKATDEDSAKYLTSDKKEGFRLLAEGLAAAPNFDHKATEEVFRGVVAKLGIPAGDLVHPVRIALTGKTIGPGLFETMSVLGKDKTVRRLQEAFG